MKNLSLKISILILFLPFCVNAQEILNNYLKIGGENNPELKSKFADYNASLEKIPQVGSLPNPNLSFGYFLSPIETKLGPQQAKIGISQMFPWFGTLGSKENVAIQLAKAKYQAFEEAKSKLFYEIKSSYYENYLVQKAIKITQENLKILHTFQQLALIKIETGKSSIVDEMRVEMEINELKNQLAYLEDKKAFLETKFSRLLNSSEEIQPLIPDTLWNDSLGFSINEMKDSMVKNNHLLKQYEHKVLSFQNSIASQKKMSMPQFTVGVDYSFIGQSENQNLGSDNGRDAILLPKIGISIPIYRRKYKAMVQEAIYNHKSAQHKKEEKENRLFILLKDGFNNYSDARRRINLFQIQKKLAEKSLNILLTSYSSDGKNFDEVLRMERKLLKYSLELDKARADKNAAVAFLNYLIGN